MRFLHKDHAPVIAHLAREGSPILMLEWESEPVAGGIALLGMQKRRPAHPARSVPLAEVENFARRKGDPREAAQVLRYYFHVNSSAPEGRPMSLVDAVAYVESNGGPDEALLAGHLEGGLVSVSRTLQPFQDGLKPIAWWGP